MVWKIIFVLIVVNSNKLAMFTTTKQNNYIMKTTIKITNPELFYGKDVQVHTESLSSLYEGECDGCILVYFDDQQMMSEGTHSYKDFERDYGFQLVQA